MKTTLQKLPNLGPRSAAMLQAAGIGTAEELRHLGAVAAYTRVKRTSPAASLNLLWALEGALTGLHWQQVSREHRTSLLLALEQHERKPPGGAIPAHPPDSVETYILGFPEEVQFILRTLRETVRSAAPHAQEIISYRMPALRQHGVLVYYAAFKNHVGFYPPIKGDSALEQASAPYAGEKGNLRFRLDEPIPYELIHQLTAFRARQDRAKHTARTKRPKTPAKE